MPGKYKKNAPRLFFKGIRLILSALFFSLVLSCSVINVQEGVSLSSTDSWIILPFQNNSQTPRASHQAEEIVTTILRIHGVDNLTSYYPKNPENKDEWPEFDDSQYRENIILESLKNDYKYAVSGSVDEWQYKVGVGNEPAVGLTFRILDVSTGKVVWSASGARSGWSLESLNGVAQKLIADLISNIQIVKK